MKIHHKALIVGGGIAVALYLLYKNWDDFINRTANSDLGGFDFGILDPTTGWDGT